MDPLRLDEPVHVLRYLSQVRPDLLIGFMLHTARVEGVVAVVWKPGAIDKIVAIIKDLAGSALIVDANPDPTLNLVLADAGYRVAITSLATEALTMLAVGQYDAVMLSLEINGLTSPDAIVYFKECNPQCLIILMSTERQSTPNSYVFAAMQKSFKIRDVIEVLDRVRTRKLENRLGEKLFEL